MARKSLSLFAALVLLSNGVANSAPTDGLSQLVLGNTQEAPIKVIAAPLPSGNREGDFIDVLQAQAEAAGVKIDLGLDHIAQKANEGSHRTHQVAAEAGKEWVSVLPDGDIEDISDTVTESSLAAEMYADLNSNNHMPWSFKLSNPSSTAETKGEPGRGWIWKSCGMDADAVRVDSIDVTPDPPKPGRNMTVRGTGVVRSLIDEGSYVDVVVKIGLIKLLSRRFDLCEEAKNANAQVQCPIKPGTYDIEQTVALPREIPPAKFNVHITGATQAEEDLMCLDLSINFMHI